MKDHPFLVTFLTIGMTGLILSAGGLVLIWESYVAWQIWQDLGFFPLTYLQVIGLNAIYSAIAGTRPMLKREEDTWKKLAQAYIEAPIAVGLLWLTWEVILWWVR